MVSSGQFAPEFSLVAPDENIRFLVRVAVPSALPVGTYTGALSLRGLRQQAFRLSVEVDGAKAVSKVIGGQRQVRGHKTSGRKNESQEICEGEEIVHISQRECRTLRPGGYSRPDYGDAGCLARRAPERASCNLWSRRDCLADQRLCCTGP